MAGASEDQSPSFDAESYLMSRFYDVNVRDRILFHLECYQEAFQLLPNSIRVLDYGTGPALLSVVSAARMASEIVLSDYAETNREQLRKWLRKDATAFDWSPYFDYVVQKLEGLGEKDAREREERLREIVQDVACCNITEDPPIRTTCQGPYDVVSDPGCLISACYTIEDFIKGVVKLAALLKRGGTFMSMSSERKMNSVTGYYVVGSQRFPILSLTGEYMVGILEQQGFSDITLKRCSIDNSTTKSYQDDDLLGYMFITAKKF